MSAASWVLSDDISGVALWAALGLAAVAVVMLLVELRGRERGGVAIFLTGIVAIVLLTLAVLRPVHVDAHSNAVGPRVVVLFDQSRRLLLPTGDDSTRRERGMKAAKAIEERFRDARLSLLGFSRGKLEPFSLGDVETSLPESPSGSDLSEALSRLAAEPGEHPKAVIVLSDGRLSSPTAGLDEPALTASLGSLGVPIHTVALAKEQPRDASIRRVRAAGAAVAHQALSLSIDVGCGGGLSCKEIPVRARELRDGVAAAELSHGVVQMQDGEGSVELEITLDRAGSRVVEVSIEPPEGDTIPANDVRLLTFEVARDRVRLLHLAGRPTYDVRALRTWLKSNESVDVVAFFILRGLSDDPDAHESELALIRFPVDELFTEHLPSFDAIILQDIDAELYKLAQYLSRLNQYVKTGGGLIMVGGPSSFAGGKYAGTPLDEILPTEQPTGGKVFDPDEFVPSYTEAGLAAPMTRSLRELLGGKLPSLAGVNILGVPRPSSIVLWEHPKLTAGAKAMPVLALGEVGDGRSIALSVDSTHRLLFSQFAASVSGRGYGALWDGLLGWLMRDPRYEAARVELASECVAGKPTSLRVTRLPGMSGDIEITLSQHSEKPETPHVFSVKDPPSGPVEVAIGSLDVGGYTAKVRIGAAPPTRYDFGCELGGEAWSDSRPDADRLARIASLTKGKAVAWDDVDALPEPELTQITSERHTSPVLPPWGWTLGAALFLGAHWLSRRFGGLT
jgi:uncharacterized membrane protein